MSASERVALIRAAAGSHWLSQNQVHRQFENAYRAAFPGRCLVLAFDPRRGRSGPGLDGAGRVAILDHHLELAELRGLLAAPAAQPRRLTVHLFADFLTRPAQIRCASELAHRFATTFIVASRWMSERVARALPGAEIRVIPSPVSEAFFKTEPAGRATKAPLWAYAGRIHPDKGLDQLLEHLARGGRPSRFAILGAWSDEPYESWSTTAEDFRSRQARLRSLVEALAPKPRWIETEEGLARAFQGMDAFVFPSVFKAEEYGYALAQALASGKPCWVSDWLGHRDFAGCPGVRTLPVADARGVPAVDFRSVPASPPATPRTLPQAIRRWARANHSIAAAAARLRALR